MKTQRFLCCRKLILEHCLGDPKASEGLKKRFYQVKHEYLCVSDVNEFVYMQGNNIRTKFVQNINNVSKA